jgi:hypothetical protein
MRALIQHIDLKVILLAVFVVCYATFRLLFFGIGTNKWKRWLRDEPVSRKSKPVGSH